MIITDPKKYMARYVGLKMETDGLRERLDRVRNEELLPGARGDSNVGGGRPGGGAGDQLGAKVIRRMDIEERLLPLLEEKERQMELIEEAVEVSCDPMQRTVLRRKYIDFDGYREPTWLQVTLAICKSDEEKDVKNITRIHGRALQAIGWLIQEDTAYQIDDGRRPREYEKSHP